MTVMKQLHTSLTLSDLPSFHWLNRIHSDGVQSLDWIGLSSVLHPRQHSIGSMGDGFYRSKDQQYQSTEGKSYKGKPRKIKQQNTHTNTK